MCTSPIIIKNNRKRFIPYVDKEYLSVPCGHCLECRNKKRNDLYVLSYFEHLQALYNGGFTQFFTLTYDDDHLPTHGFKPCFSRDDVQGFFKRVVTKCKRKFGNDFKIRRLITCELGSITKRPHYHFLCFVQQPCNHHEFRRILRESWPFGFSFGSWDNFGEVNRPSGIRYVTKYVCKDVFDDTEDREELEELKSFGDRFYWSKKRVLPFTLHSKQYGFCALAHIFGDSSPLPDHLQTPLDVIIKTGKIRMFGSDGNVEMLPLPRSLYRKLFFSITWRYKRVTKRDVEFHECRGTKVPKRKVQSYYIPNHLYADFFRSSVDRKLDILKFDLKTIDGDVSDSVVRTVFLDPDFSVSSGLCDYSFENYINEKIKINEIRDPIFERDPFDGSFSYRRAPLERVNFPKMREFMLAAYSPDVSSLSRSYDSRCSKLNKFSYDKNCIIEKTYRDNKILNSD